MHTTHKATIPAIASTALPCMIISLHFSHLLHGAYQFGQVANSCTPIRHHIVLATRELSSDMSQLNTDKPTSGSAAAVPSALPELKKDAKGLFRDKR